jgi:hypothetical protein
LLNSELKLQASFPEDKDNPSSEGNIILSGRGEGDIILSSRGRGRGEDNSTFSSNNDNVVLIGSSRNNFEGIRKHLEVFIF